jgi:N-formylglutamate amidohydrolase
MYMIEVTYAGNWESKETKYKVGPFTIYESAENMLVALAGNADFRGGVITVVYGRPYEP